jgi:hypothetical protein
MADETAVDAYKLRREVDLIRRRLYSDIATLDEAERAKLIERMTAIESSMEDGAVAEPAPAGTPSAPAPRGPDSFTLGAGARKIKAAVQLRMDRLPTAMIHLLDPRTNPLVSVQVTSTDLSPQRVRVATVVERYSATSVSTVEVSRNTSAPAVEHLPTFFPDALDRVTELTKATVRVAVTDIDGTMIDEGTFAVTLLARTTAVLHVKDPATNTTSDLSRYLGAWVTPNAPEVMEVLREAAGLVGGQGIVGYLRGPTAVDAQAQAIFDALAARGITYVNSIIGFGSGAGESVQRVRRPAEALAHRSANCLDGTVLVASILEAASINPGIALVPGHALVAWETEEGTGQWSYLETTYIGTRSYQDARRFGELQANERTPTVLSLATLRGTHGITPME